VDGIYDEIERDGNYASTGFCSAIPLTRIRHLQGFICDWGSDIYGVLTFDDDQASSNNPTNVHVRDPSVQAGVSSAFDVVLASGPAFTWLRRD
jgi:hypothetical protein